MSKAHAALQPSQLSHRRPPHNSCCRRSSTPGGHSVKVTLHQLAIMHREEALLPPEARPLVILEHLEDSAQLGPQPPLERGQIIIKIDLLSADWLGLAVSAAE